MKKIVLMMGVTADGRDAGGWIPEEIVVQPDVQKDLWEGLDSIDTFLMGRITYEVWFDAWPKLRTSESPFDARFSQFADDVEKVVVSNTLTTSEWKNSSVIRGDLRSEIVALKERHGKDIAIVGGTSVAQAIGKLGLIDEYRLWVHPLVKGDGPAPFATAGDAIDLALIQAKCFDSGLVALHYARTK